MTPDLVVAGGMTQSGEPDVEFVHAPGDEPAVRLRYVTPEHPSAAPLSYSARVVPLQLAGVVRRTERGWVGTAAALHAIGYGDTPEAAVDDLLDEIEQYLEFLREDSPELAPPIADHAKYVALLDVPRAIWLASVIVHASPLE